MERIQRNTKQNRWFLPGLCLMLIMLIVGAMGCGQQKVPEGATSYSVYVLGKDKNKIFAQEYYSTATEAEVIIQELIEQMSIVPEKLDYVSPLADKVMLQSYDIADGKMTIDFAPSYLEQESITEILIRASIVRTFTQVPGVEYVTFTVAGEPLNDPEGRAVGVMSADTFIDNDGNEINTYEKTTLHLYFASRDGMGLVETTRAVVYNSNISMDKLVMEQLIAGPVVDGLVATINPATKIVNITVKDGICYVNLDENFLIDVTQVSDEVTIYSIVNSLSELPNVNKVQILVNGDENMTYHENISLGTPIERNLDLVE